MIRMGLKWQIRDNDRKRLAGRCDDIPRQTDVTFTLQPTHCLEFISWLCVWSVQKDPQRSEQEWTLMYPEPLDNTDTFAFCLRYETMVELIRFVTCTTAVAVQCSDPEVRLSPPEKICTASIFATLPSFWNENKGRGFFVCLFFLPLYSYSKP